MHGAQRVLEAAVLGGRKDPARGLQLGHAAEALHPRAVDEVLLGGLPRGAVRPGIEDVLVDGVRDETTPLVGIDAPHGLKPNLLVARPRQEGRAPETATRGGSAQERAAYCVR